MRFAARIEFQIPGKRTTIRNVTINAKDAEQASEIAQVVEETWASRWTDRISHSDPGKSQWLMTCTAIADDEGGEIADTTIEEAIVWALTGGAS